MLVKVLLLSFFSIDDFINFFVQFSCLVPENQEERAKRRLIEEALKDPSTTIEKWREFAKTEYGLINGTSWRRVFRHESWNIIYCFVDDLRRSVWPLLLGVDREQCDPVPTLQELSNHPEYNQVVLDVNRSLKRFPPGIPIQQRLALQDQLTVIILRVITKYPHLSYYQVSWCKMFYWQLLIKVLTSFLINKNFSFLLSSLSPKGLSRYCCHIS